MSYVPALERKNPNFFEFPLTLPPNSTTVISFEIEKLFLRWTEYPPDANLGFYIPSSILLAVLPDAPPDASIQSLREDYGVVRLYSEKLLVAMPTPDFSMPYNVICLACTVVAIAFGSFHNLSTKILVRDTEKKPSLPKRALLKIKAMLGMATIDAPAEIQSKKKSPKKKIIKTISVDTSHINKEGETNESMTKADKTEVTEETTDEAEDEEEDDKPIILKPSRKSSEELSNPEAKDQLGSKKKNKKKRKAKKTEDLGSSARNDAQVKNADSDS